MSKKIVLYTNTLCTGGVETVVVNLANNLSLQGNEVAIYYQSGKCLHDLDHSIKVVKLYKTDRKRSLFEKIFRTNIDPYTKSLKENIRSFKPDVIISFKCCTFKSLLECNFRGKTIGSIHGYYKYDCLDKYLKRNLKRINTITVLTNENKSYYSTYNQNTLIAYNPLNLPKETSNTQKKKQIVCVSRLDNDKSVDLFIQAASIAKHKLPEYTFLVAGSGTLESSLKQLNEKLNSPVTFLGNLNREETHKLYRESETSVLCSKAECFPNVLLEAAHFYTARISTRFDGDGLNVLIHHGEDGLISELDANDLALQIIRISKDSELRKKLLIKAKNLADQNQAQAMSTWTKLLSL